MSDATGLPALRSGFTSDHATVMRLNMGKFFV
jgi:hypothetical protein